MIRVLIVDDQALVRAGMRVLLEAAGDIDVVGEAGDGGEAVSLAERLRPEVILMDIRMPHVDGIEATRRVLDRLPGVHVLILTTFAEDANVYGALRAGAVGFLVKDGDPGTMIDAVRRVARGEPLLAPPVLARVVAQALAAHDDTTRERDEDTLRQLSQREREVLALIGVGLSNSEIGDRLHLGVTTVKTHVSTAMAKLGTRNRVQAGIVAHRLGLVDENFQPRHR